MWSIWKGATYMMAINAFMKCIYIHCWCVIWCLMVCRSHPNQIIQHNTSQHKTKQYNDAISILKDRRPLWMRVPFNSIVNLKETNWNRKLWWIQVFQFHFRPQSANKVFRRRQRVRASNREACNRKIFNCTVLDKHWENMLFGSLK